MHHMAEGLCAPANAWTKSRSSVIYRFAQRAWHALNAFWHWLRQLTLPTHEWLQVERFWLHSLGAQF